MDFQDAWHHISLLALPEISFFCIFQVVLASVPHMQCGFSRDLFIQWCGNPKNSIILTCRTQPGTLARQLIDDTNKKHVTVQVRIEMFQLRIPPECV